MAAFPTEQVSAPSTLIQGHLKQNSQRKMALAHGLGLLFLCVLRICKPTFQKNKIHISTAQDRLCGLVVRVSSYRYRGPGFDSRRYQIF